MWGVKRWYRVSDEARGFPDVDVLSDNVAHAATEIVAYWQNECGPGEAWDAPIDVVLTPIRDDGEALDLPPIRARVKPIYIGWRAEVVS